MKGILVLLSVFLPFVTLAQSNDALWKKADKASKAGKPQSEASVLRQLEENAVKAGDDLEHLYISGRLYEAMTKYDWKQAREYWPVHYELQNKFKAALDSSIAASRGHRRVTMLLWWRVERHLNEASSLQPQREEAFKDVRQECKDIIAVCPEDDYIKKIRSVLSQMESQSFNVSSKVQAAPKENVIFTVNSRNVSKAVAKVYLLNKGFFFQGGDTDKALQAVRKNSTLVEEELVTGFKDKFNISEEKEFSIKFAAPGVYVIFFNSGECTLFRTVFVSRIAAAIRQREGSPEIFAADISTGEPIREATVTLFDNNDTFVPVEKAYQKYSAAYNFDGFTKVAVDTNDFSLSRTLRYRVSVPGDEASPLMSYLPQASSRYNDSRPVRNYEAFFTDRGIYRPGDTVYFKSVSYRSDRSSGVTVCGKALEVRLWAASSRVIVDSVKVVSNDMGSSSGFFVLPLDAMSGTYRISSSNGSVSFRVEVYKRPTFEIILNSSSDVHCFSDVVLQRGRLESFAGYKVSGARVEYEVTRYPRRNAGHSSQKVASGAVYSDNDGAFEIPFPAERPEDAGDDASVSYQVTVKATDPQGETHREEISVPVSDEPIDIAFDLDGTASHEDALIVDKTEADSFSIKTTNLNGLPYSISGRYTIKRGESTIKSLTFNGNEAMESHFGELPSGRYTLVCEVNYRGRNISRKQEVILISPSDTRLPFDKTLFYHALADKGRIDFLIGTSEENLYLEMELLDGERLLYRKALHLQDEMIHVELPFLKEYGTGVTLSLFGFHKGETIECGDTFTNPTQTEIPLVISSFRDRTAPRTKEKVVFKTAPGAEIMVSIFDRSAEEAVGVHHSFYFSPLYSTDIRHIPYISSTLEPSTRMMPYYSVMTTKAAIPFQLVNSDAVSSDAVETQTKVAPRTDLSELVGFFPHVRASADATAEIEYVSGDLLSTYRILALAHTKDLKKGSAEASFTVQKPLMVIPSLPLFVRAGDRIVLKSKIVNMSGRPVDGTASIELTDVDGEKIKGVKLKDKTLSILDGAHSEASWEITVPRDIDTMDVAVTFSDGNISDGERQRIIVEPDEETLTEAVSFVIGEDRDFKYYEKQLKSRFSAVKGTLTRSTYSTMEAVKEALPKARKPECENAINWISEFFINQMGCKYCNDGTDYEAFRAEAFSRIKSFQSTDGGLRWFPGMSSSLTLTLFYLERMAQMRRSGAIALNDDEMASVRKALAFVDGRISSSDGCGAQMLDIRTMWMDQPLSEGTRKVLERYLETSVDGWQDLPILAKAHHLDLLLNCKEGGYHLMDRRILPVKESLIDYAVDNATAGCYFPNAVMPFRGLMNNEIYAHAHLLTVFHRLGEDKFAKSLARWLLLQKHSQAWGDNVATADAVDAILSSGAPDLKLGAVCYTYRTRMNEVTQSSNQIEVTREFLRTDGTALMEGERLKTGDEIVVRYHINNSENRSFVSLKAMRPASLYPKDINSYFSRGYYRQVRESYTAYYWELLPEYKSTLEERFFVTQEGTFTTGLVEIESLYATEYRGHTSSFLMTSE